MSSVYLWSKYDLNSLKDVRLEDEQLTLCESSGLYFNSCLKLLQSLCMELTNNSHQNMNDNDVGFVAVSRSLEASQRFASQ
ncbi:hypothetical protein PACTADRAFT_1145 [Pachysolen tannophilus NRRL Y-2460]|uniref:Uncharacterized protein n=1 Tax=Pachysolen tannophilus NRRL Y-2460 TaxID=669874 RepID=A0A1E4TXT4_PACTA|nr:hypothetical protein PACTADRAFT_1145 [Pachysolen tannophilus NRRL Y-2460]